MGGVEIVMIISSQFLTMKPFKEDRIMDAKKSKRILRGTVLTVFIFLLTIPLTFAGEYPSFEGADEIKAVFDVRVSKPKSAALQIDLIHTMFHDENIRKIDETPEFVVIFIGPATKLVSTSIGGYSMEEKNHIRKIAETVKAMADDGIKLEICIVAARVFKVDPATILPEITQVENGWISLIGYQTNGYSLIPVY